MRLNRSCDVSTCAGAGRSRGARSCWRAAANPQLQHGLARLLDRLDDLLGGVARQPALIHGDLWRNNVLCDTKSQPVLIDPHAAYADREYELMIAEDYGGFGLSFFAAYEALWPSEPGRAERRAPDQYTRCSSDSARRTAARPTRLPRLCSGMLAYSAD